MRSIRAQRDHWYDRVGNHRLDPQRSRRHRTRDVDIQATGHTHPDRQRHLPEIGGHHERPRNSARVINRTRPGDQPIVEGVTVTRAHPKAATPLGDRPRTRTRDRHRVRRMRRIGAHRNTRLDRIGNQRLDVEGSRRDRTRYFRVPAAAYAHLDRQRRLPEIGGHRERPGNNAAIVNRTRPGDQPIVKSIPVTPAHPETAPAAANRCRTRTRDRHRVRRMRRIGTHRNTRLDDGLDVRFDIHRSHCGRTLTVQASAHTHLDHHRRLAEIGGQGEGPRNIAHVVNGAIAAYEVIVERVHAVRGDGQNAASTAVDVRVPAVDRDEVARMRGIGWLTKMVPPRRPGPRSSSGTRAANSTRRRKQPRLQSSDGAQHPSHLVVVSPGLTATRWGEIHK